MSETFCALATAPGRAAVAVVRINGPRAFAALSSLAGEIPAPRRAALRRLRHPTTDESLDEALVLAFPGPASFTGDDLVELHLHGGSAVVAAVLEALSALDVRVAEPGEFTRRAFENGKLDLSRAEAIADLVDAETEAQRRQALGQLGGALELKYSTWRAALVEALAFIEAQIDFPDEEVPPEVAARARRPLEQLRQEMATALCEVRGERVREGFRIALVGAPNAGKSSLLNALAGRDAAIVTPIPGTTRDVIEVPAVLGGYKVLLADTAGLRDTADPIEQEGVRRARAWAESADLRLWVVDGSMFHVEHPPEGLIRPSDWLVLNKADLSPGAAASASLTEAEAQAWRTERLSALNLADVARLQTTLASHVAERLSGAEFPGSTRLRHRDALAGAVQSLDRALARLAADAELAGEDVRLAARALERITGRIDPDAVLDQIFASFCLGK
jgi:tRNA modification GTPase